MKNTRVAGHTLRYEGAPFEWRGRRPVTVHTGWSSAGTGFALCSCGATSDVLTSAAARKRWHAQHKLEVTREDTP